MRAGHERRCNMTNDLEQRPLAGKVSTPRHSAVLWRAGSDWGELFEDGVEYTGLTLTIEIRSYADAMAMLAAIGLPGTLAVAEAPTAHPRWAVEGEV